jgi:hypothetical protein
VVGLGVNASSLDQVAQAGGTQGLLAADDQQTLTDALSKIARGAVSCDLVLDKDPPDIAQVYVFFNDALPALAKSEWSYAASTRTITFLNQRCDDLRDGKVTDIDVVFGCPNPTLK